MTLPLVLLASAEADLADASEWYRQIGPHLEDEFEASLHQTLQRIRFNPTAYESEGPFRRAFLHRFPYRIVYRATDAVIAVLHTSRDPRVWQAPRPLAAASNADASRCIERRIGQFRT